MIKQLNQILWIAVACLWAGVANASIVYNFEAFSSYGPLQSGSFQYTSPTFVAGPITTVSANQLDYVQTIPPTEVGTQVVFYQDNSAFSTGGTYDVLSFGPWWLYYFEADAFDQVGIYDTVVLGSEQAGRLTVTDDSASVPEPSTLLLLGAGFAGVGFLRRKKHC
jgi:hypothetical protein